MTARPGAPASAPARKVSLLAVATLFAAVHGCAVYANLSFAVSDPADLRFFPPFERHVNANMNRHLVTGTEYSHIARSLLAGEGFANPFGQHTGPTAWMPPVLPVALAGLFRICGGDRDLATGAAVFLQVWALLVTGLLVLALARRTTAHTGMGVGVTVFLFAVLCDFRLWFQFTHDYGLVLLAIDLLLAGSCLWEPLRSRRTAAGWGLAGGLCALVNPVAGFVWGAGSLAAALGRRAWTRYALAVAVAGLAVTPWTIRNYLVFGRWIPVKSNAAYELYQSQCLQPDGLLQLPTFHKHPIAGGAEREAYDTLGEMAFLDQKRAAFFRAVRAKPGDFLERVTDRLVGATLWHMPFERDAETRRPWMVWLARLGHPIPFLALLSLIFTAPLKPLGAAQWTVIAVYVLYLLPYIAISFYGRYALPLVGVKALLVLWAVDRLLAFRYRHFSGMYRKA